MADKIFGADFTNNTTPASTSTISINNGTTLEDVALSDLFSLVASSAPRNLIINGSMDVAQRATSLAGITTSGYWGVDRWKALLNALGTYTQSQAADAPSGGYPFTNSLKMLVTTADAAPAAGDYAIIQQTIEGQYLQNVLKGTAGARQLALQFWVKSSVTGTYICELLDNTNTRQVSASYTVSVANTWERKTIVFPADTTGSFPNNATGAMTLNFWMAAGTTYTSGTLQTTWAATSNANRAVGQVNAAATINNVFQITGVQLEANTTQSTYEYQPFDFNLNRCLRYYQKTFNYATAPAQNAGALTGELIFPAVSAGATVQRYFARLPVIMRSSSATITTYNPSAANAQVRDETNAVDCSATAITGQSDNGFQISATGNAASTVGARLGLHYAIDAEL